MVAIKDKTISGIFWSLLQAVGGRGITFVVMIVLARLLTPEMFGLIGMLMIFVQVSQTLVQAGFSQALIQKKDTDEEHYSSVFWINLVLSILIYIVLFFAAPVISAFYNQPILVNLTRVLSLIFVINAFSYVQEARLSKELKFRTLTIKNIPSTIIGGGVGIVMALLNFGVWSIVAVQIVTRFAYAIQLWFYTGWKPRFSFNKKKVRKLFSFGSKLMLSGVIDTIYRNIYLVVIGKFFPLSALGYYQNAENLVRIPTTTLSGALRKVAFAAFSTIQDDDRKIKEGYRKIIQQAFFWICPMFIFAGVLAKPLFRLLFTEKWLPSVPYFHWLCIVGIFLPLSIYNLNIINVKGRSDLFLKLEIFKKIIVTIGVIIAIPFGIKALLIFQALNSVFSYFLNSYYSGVFINYSAWEQLKDVLPVFGLSILVGLLILFLDRTFYGLSDIVRVVVFGGGGVAAFGLTAAFLKIDPMIELKTIVHTKILNRFNK